MTDTEPIAEVSETSTASFPGLTIDTDVDIRLRDGCVLRADVFRPDDGEPAPVIITLGPYPKDIHFKDWSRLPPRVLRLPPRARLPHALGDGEPRVVGPAPLRSCTRRHEGNRSFAACR